MNFGLPCCAIELIATSTSKHDFIIPFAHGPLQADLLVVAGTLTDKMAPPEAGLRADPRTEVRHLARCSANSSPAFRVARTLTSVA